MIGRFVVAGIFALLLGGILLVRPSSTAAQSLTNTAVRQVGSINDCKERARGGSWVSIDCSPGFASDHDRLTVVSRGSVSPAAPWASLLDMRDAIWVYDTGATGDPQLVVNFHPISGSGVQADIYDSTSDLRPSYKLLQGFPGLLDRARPVVQIVNPDGWWIRNGIINFNLQMTVDGKVMGAFGAERFLDDLSTDGHADFTINVYDSDHDGRPESELVQATPVISEQDSIFRSEVLVNTAHNEPPLSNYWLWPFLSFNVPGKSSVEEARLTGTTTEAQSWPCSVVKDYNNSQPPVWVNSTTGTVQCITEMVASRGSGNNWFAYSVSRLGANPAQTADWESPFAFYDLAGAKDGWPDTIVRVVNWNRNDQYASCDACLLTGPMQIIRYSWDTNHGHNWSYKVDLVGRHPINTPVSAAGIQFQSIPYEQVPAWVSQQAWDATAFVAVERPSYWTSEGIYEWDAEDNVWADYVTGSGSDVPNSNYSTIDPGFRGEYTLVPQPRTTLYFSPIDHRLHLLNATAGVWNDANQREVRYQTLGTPYVVRWDARDIASDFHGTPDDASKLTAWNLDRQQEQPESLTFAGGQLVLATSTGVYVKNGPDQSSEFETAPPVDHASWLTLKDQLQPRQATFAGTDLQAMFDQFPATTQSVSGGRLRDFRLVAGGFRFILDVPTLGSTANWLAGKPIGSYLVEFQNGAYSATSLTPAAVAVSGVSTSAQRPIALNPLELTATLQNSGGDDAPYQVVSFTATNGSQNMDLGAVMISVLAGGGAQATVSWVPPSAGRWQISAQAAGGSARSQTTVDVTAPPTTSLPGMLTVQRLPVDGQAAVGIVLGVALLTAVSLGLLSWRHVPGYRVGADRLD